MGRRCGVVAAVWIGIGVAAYVCPAATVQKRYYARPPKHDRHGVIAPWYEGQNGQLDFRIRVAAETLKRYPWVLPPQSVAPAPHYVFSGHWKIAGDGTITPLATNDWDTGDLGQRAAYVLSGLVDYYRYSGDAAAIAHLTLQADALLDHCLTPGNHPWPRFLISVPTKGKCYGRCDPRGMIQLDIVAEVGLAMLRAYQVTGNRRWLEACCHWGDLLAQKRNRRPGEVPWGRYANPEAAPWKDGTQTGGVVFLLYFFDELIRLGHTGPNNEIVQARQAGLEYLRQHLLPRWTGCDTWGRNYWDWANPVQAENVTEFAARYFMDHKEEFPHWKTDARNILGLFFNRTGVCPTSAGDMYSGAWAFPESSGCCGRSLWYGPMELAAAWAQYAAEAQNPWARELARRMQLLATYDGHETGVSEDNIDGGFVVNHAWFKIAHPMALKHLLATVAWLPEWFAPCRENHIVRSTAVVNSVQYGPGRIEFSTFDAPAGTTTALRLAFTPESIVAQPGDALPLRHDLGQNGYTIRPLPGGDCLVTIRHEGLRCLVVAGPGDPQQFAGPEKAVCEGPWPQPGLANQGGASISWTFRGNQVRLVGDVAADGGLAEVYLDGTRQLVGIDTWNPTPRERQILYYRNGLAEGQHSLKIVVLGRGNPLAQGTRVRLHGVQFSDARGVVDFGEGGGPTDRQRMVFGYPGREDLKDSAGNLWRPATEWVIRTGTLTDSVEKAWWTSPVIRPILGTSDPDLYRYGVHGREFWLNATVGPGTYHVRLKFAATRGLDACNNCVTVAINGQPVVERMDVAATAGGPDRAADLVFSDIEPRNGAIEIRFRGGDHQRGISGEAFVQAVEIGPGPGGTSAKPITVLARNLLRNAGFEQWEDPSAAARSGSVPSSWRVELPAGSHVKIGRESQAAPLPHVPEGREALRISGQGRARVVQEVAVRPQSVYRGSAWVRVGLDAPSANAGRPPAMDAALILEELDQAGRVVATHPPAAMNQPGPWQFLARQITTTGRTARVRWALHATLPEGEPHAWISLDQAVLDGPPAPAAVAGRVVDSRQRRPLAYALVTGAGRSARTSEDGTFCFDQLEDLAAVELRAERQGFYPQVRPLVLSAGDNRVELALVPLPTNNLLANGDFEQGFAPARSVEHGVSGTRGPWQFAFSPQVACYIYPESIYTWRKPRVFRGKEAISQVTDGGGEIRLFQEVAVNPCATLCAAVWVLGLDVAGNGQGFGAAPDDFAGLEIEELDPAGRLLVRHPPVGIRKATADFQRISLQFSTRPETARIRFTLRSKIGCVWQHGAAIFDDAALVQIESARKTSDKDIADPQAM